MFGNIFSPVNPSDIIKFDSTDFIALPNNWSTSTDAQIQAVRENGDSDINNNQIKTVYIADQGDDYTLLVVNLIY